MRNSSAANSAASSPPAPARISSTMFLCVVRIFGQEQDLKLLASTPRARVRALELLFGHVRDLGSFSQMSSLLAVSSWLELLVAAVLVDRLLKIRVLLREPAELRGSARDSGSASRLFDFEKTAFDDSSLSNIGSIDAPGIQRPVAWNVGSGRQTETSVSRASEATCDRTLGAGARRRRSALLEPSTCRAKQARPRAGRRKARAWSASGSTMPGQIIARKIGLSMRQAHSLMNS